MHATVLKRPGVDSTFAWVASQPSTEYGSWFSTNQEIMSRIADEIDDAWAGVTHVFAMHYILNPSGTQPGIQGESDLGVADIPGFDGIGETQFIFTWGNPGMGKRQVWLCLHEFGHNIGLGHPPGSGDGGSSFPEPRYGRYDLMVQNPRPWLIDGGIVPYNPIALADIGWLPVVELTEDATGVEIADAFDPVDASAVFVRVDERQAFFIVNHQAANSYEAIYGGTGLLVWHIALKPSYPSPIWFRPKYAAVWDLELASGKIDTATSEPDPDEGLDAMERNEWYLGSGDDFFDGETEFSCQSNPNSNLYDSLEWQYITATPQHVRSSVALENMSVDQSGIATIDVRISASFYPNGGEPLTRGTTETIVWNLRCGDCTSVDILLSRDGGTTYCVLAEDQPNTGSFEWYVIEAGSKECRVKVVSHSSCTETWSDESDANFSIVDLRPCQ